MSIQACNQAGSNRTTHEPLPGKVRAAPQGLPRAAPGGLAAAVRASLAPIRRNLPVWAELLRRRGTPPLQRFSAAAPLAMSLPGPAAEAGVEDRQQRCPRLLTRAWLTARSLHLQLIYMCGMLAMSIVPDALVSDAASACCKQAYLHLRVGVSDSRISCDVNSTG